VRGRKIIIEGTEEFCEWYRMWKQMESNAVEGESLLIIIIIYSDLFDQRNASY